MPSASGRGVDPILTPFRTTRPPAGPSDATVRVAKDH
jgi:hypothetical protein